MAHQEEWIKPVENELYSIIDGAVFKYLLRSYLKAGNIEFNLLIDENSFKYSSKDLIKSLNITITGTMKNNRSISHQQIITINLTNEICKNCSNLRGGTYFLAIIQLRVKDETHFDSLNHIINEIHEYVDKLFPGSEVKDVTIYKVSPRYLERLGYGGAGGFYCRYCNYE